MTDMTLEQKALLEPYGKIFADMGQTIRKAPDDALKTLLNACYAASATNCWCCSFDAAQWLQREIRRELGHRERMAAKEKTTAAVRT